MFQTKDTKTCHFLQECTLVYQLLEPYCGCWELTQYYTRTRFYCFLPLYITHRLGPCVYCNRKIRLIHLSLNHFHFNIFWFRSVHVTQFEMEMGFASCENTTDLKGLRYDWEKLLDYNMWKGQEIHHTSYMCIASCNFTPKMLQGWLLHCYWSRITRLTGDLLLVTL